jgi:hypothetical protein
VAVFTGMTPVKRKEYRTYATTTHGIPSGCKQTANFLTKGIILGPELNKVLQEVGFGGR